MPRVEAAAYVGLYEDGDLLVLEGTSQCVQALVGTPLGAVAVATVLAQRLEEWFEHTLGGQCHHCVLEAADPQRASRLPTGLGNVYPALGLRCVFHGKAATDS